MDLTKISNNELDARLLRLAATERKITQVVLWHVLECSSRRLYLVLGYANMISYMTAHLGYCETSALNRISSSELLRKAPEVIDKIESGQINLTQMTQLRRHIREEEKKTGAEFSAVRTQDILQKLENKNIFETAKTLAVEFDRPLKMDVILRPQKDGSIRAEMTFTAEQFTEIQEALRNNAHSVPDGNLPEVIALLARKNNQAKLGKKKQQEMSPAENKKIRPKIAKSEGRKNNDAENRKTSQTNRTCESAYNDPTAKVDANNISVIDPAVKTAENSAYVINPTIEAVAENANLNRAANDVSRKPASKNPIVTVKPCKKTKAQRRPYISIKIKRLLLKNRIINANL